MTSHLAGEKSANVCSKIPVSKPHWQKVCLFLQNMAYLNLIVIDKGVVHDEKYPVRGSSSEQQVIYSYH
jgi:hypothetical protein